MILRRGADGPRDRAAAGPRARSCAARYDSHVDPFRPSDVPPERVDVSFADRVVGLAVFVLLNAAGTVASLTVSAISSAPVLPVLCVGLTVTGLVSGAAVGWLAAPPERSPAAVVTHTLWPIGLGSAFIWMLVTLMSVSPGGADFLAFALVALPFVGYTAAFALLGVWLARRAMSSAAR